MQPVIEIFHQWLSSAIDEEGVSIPHGIAVNAKAELTMYALALSPAEGYAVMLKEWAFKGAEEIIFAFDRFTKPGQGTTLGDLVAGHHFVRGEASRPFIIEYQHAPRVVKPIEWTNPYWNDALRRELRGAMANLGVRA